MTNASTFETLQATSEALDTISANSLQVSALHVRCTADPTYVGVRVNELRDLLAWCDHHRDIPPLTVYQADKGTNLYYPDGVMRDGLKWHVWIHTPGATVEDLLPGVDLDAERLDSNGSLVGSITVEQLRAVVNR